MRDIVGRRNEVDICRGPAPAISKDIRKPARGDLSPGLPAADPGVLAINTVKRAIGKRLHLEPTVPEMHGSSQKWSAARATLSRASAPHIPVSPAVLSAPASVRAQAAAFQQWFHETIIAFFASKTECVIPISSAHDLLLKSVVLRGGRLSLRAMPHRMGFYSFSHWIYRAQCPQNFP